MATNEPAIRSGDPAGQWFAEAPAERDEEEEAEQGQRRDEPDQVQHASARGIGPLRHLVAPAEGWLRAQ